MTPYLYPDQWHEVAAEIRAICDYCCMVCGKQCRRPGELNLGWQYQLTVAHWWHEYESPTAFVVAACLPCHFLHDAPYVWQARRRAQRARQLQRGQLVFAFH